ncbi:MAG: hypothetical protein IKS52_10515, partial [Clostridia bacterium]|nr:hypothetical protein [Clostridia bacterium]
MKRLKRAAVIALLLLQALTGAARADASHTFFAMDTVMTVTVPDANSALLPACEEEVRRLEALFSVTSKTRTGFIRAIPFTWATPFAKAMFCRSKRKAN